MQDDSAPVAIMTWYTYRNYGTALQASAIYYWIKRLGYNPTMIQYYPGRKKEKMTVPLFIKKSVRWVLRHIFGSNQYQSEGMERLYDEFLKERITESHICESEQEFHMLNDEYRAFVCGSDQIWSPLCFDENYFLPFIEDEEKLIAYAPSIGSFDIPDNEIGSKMKELMSRFQHLSIRETYGADAVHKLTGKPVKVVLDPTLLLNADEWDEYAQVEASKKIAEPYIICYFLGKPSRYREFVAQFQNAVGGGLKAYVIPILRDLGKFPDFPFEVGPREFVSLIKNAAFVCTDSFHGMAFAINYGVPFYVFKRFDDDDPLNQNSRVFSLLELLGLKERLIPLEVNEDIVRGMPCDYTDAYEKLSKLRDESLEFLSTSLKCATEKRSGQ